LSHSAHPAAKISHDCRNCGTYAPLKFCPKCGQETALHPPSVGEFLHEFVGHYVAFEGKLWATLGRLIFRPGRLTLEYLAGRKVRYVLPLRLYLTASFLFFLLIKVAGLGQAQAPPAAGSAAGGKPVSESSASDGDTGTKLVIDNDLSHCLDANAGCGRIQTVIAKAKARAAKDPAAAMRQLTERFMADLPYAIFLLLPVYAWLLKLFHWRSPYRFGEHLVFALHIHTFWFLLLFAITLLPDAAVGPLFLVGMVHGVLALRAVYGGSWRVSVLRAFGIAVLYIAVISGALLLLSFLLFLF
jgi:hypothetical protein